MEMCKTTLAVALSMSLFITFALAATDNLSESPAATVTFAGSAMTAETNGISPPLEKMAGEISGGGYGDKHPWRPRPPMTCDRFPHVCKQSGEPGRVCCLKQCVDITCDDFNCGRCGIRCGYGHKCCGGKCVPIMYDRNNCGGCGKKCKKGSQCSHGMCNYGY